jgi:hypothetical protein
VQALADGLERGSGRLGRGRSREDADELFPGGRAPLRRRRVAAVPNGAEGLELPVDLNRLRREVCDPKVAGPSTEPGWNVGDRSERIEHVQGHGRRWRSHPDDQLGMQQPLGEPASQRGGDRQPHQPGGGGRGRCRAVGGGLAPPGSLS